MSACERCLRRTALLGLLAPWIERPRHGRGGLGGVLALPDDRLLQRLCGDKRAAVEDRLASFDPAVSRARAKTLGMRVICRHAPAYPTPLTAAADAPAVLHLIGDDALLRRASADGAVAIVGSRKASKYGREMARSLARDLAGCGVPVISGMAYGVDSEAHEGALSVRGPTIAVMPGGADVPSPSAKRSLYSRIKASGLLLAEMPPGMRPFRWSFPARNRIMAALAQMTIVVEGAEDSGSLITAAFAQDLGREVGAVPGHATSWLAAGPNKLLFEGAAIVRSAADVLDVLYGPGERSPGQAALAASGVRETVAARVEPRLQRLLAAVESGTGSVEALAEQTEVADVLAGLSELEFLGFVTRGPGGDYVRRA